MMLMYIFLLVNLANGFEDKISAVVQKSSDSILCRSCGSDILKSDSIISKLSPVAINSFNDTVFNNNKILVQVLPKDFILQFPIITSTNSSCLGTGEWEEDDQWFPGYQWQICMCSECGAMLGWIFEPLDPFSVVIPEQFFGLILAQLVGENYTDSLVTYPDF